MLFWNANSLWASEGEIRLQSLINHPNRCLASSHTNVNNTFTVLVSCRDLNYTPTASAIRYLVWASPSNSTDTIRLGELSFGKAQFSVNVPFDSLFVTIETDPRVRQPVGQIIMRGVVQPYQFLDPARPTPTPSISPTPAEDLVVVEATPTPERGISGAVKRAGVVVSIILLGLLIGFIFVITRPRR